MPSLKFPGMRYNTEQRKKIDTAEGCSLFQTESKIALRIALRTGALLHNGRRLPPGGGGDATCCRVSTDALV